MRYLEPNSDDSIGRHTCARCGCAWPCQRHPPRRARPRRIAAFTAAVVFLVACGMLGITHGHATGVAVVTPFALIVLLMVGVVWL